MSEIAGPKPVVQRLPEETCIVQVTAADQFTLTLRALVSADDAASLWNLKCRVREYLAIFCHRLSRPGNLVMRDVLADR